MCDEETFAGILADMAGQAAPEVFAVVQKYGTRVNAWIVAWGMCFPDGRTEVVSVDGTARHNANSPEDVLLGSTFGTHIRARIVRPAPVETDDEGESDDEQ